jgi:hypothetical protein
LISYLSLSDSAVHWAEAIVKAFDISKLRFIPKDVFASTGYEIRAAADSLQGFYIDVSLR